MKTISKGYKAKIMSVKEIDNYNATEGNVYTIHMTAMHTNKSI